jgi:hypothetical protein
MLLESFGTDDDDDDYDDDDYDDDDDDHALIYSAPWCLPGLNITIQKSL